MTARTPADTGAPPSPAETARFLADLTRVAGAVPPRLALAVSGGPDSMAMLLLAAAALPGRVVVATVDHRLRERAQDEAALVARHCAGLGIPHAVLVPEAPIVGSSLQARAREARYALLSRWARAQGATCLATAHQADDQAETFLMRAARGSGLAGLAGIRQRVEIAGMTVVRPVLDWRRAELRAIVRRAGAPFVDDPSNTDPRHDRTRFRDLLALHEWLGVPQLAASAAYLAEAERDLVATTDWLWGQRAEPGEDDIRVTMDGLPRELRRRLARRAITAVREAHAIDAPVWSDAVAIEPFLDALDAGRAATQAGVKASIKAGAWRFRPAPPRKTG